MNFRRTLETPDDSFQIAPLIDIVFLLLVFFIVTGALEAQEKETPIELPKTTSAVARARERLDVVVNVDRAGRIFVNNVRYSPAALRALLADVRRAARNVPVSVFLRADAKALHEDVLRVLDACSAAKVKDVLFVSTHDERAPER